MRPRESRATWLVDRRSMRLPSASVCVISVVISAEYGAPVTGSAKSSGSADITSTARSKVRPIIGGTPICS
jgi:hypothetical protein